MKIYNGYCGIGGNRKEWGSNHQITAVELDPRIATIYKDLYPDDEVIIGDAHQYLLEHYNEFDFIWWISDKSFDKYYADEVLQQKIEFNVYLERN